LSASTKIAITGIIIFILLALGLPITGINAGPIQFGVPSQSPEPPYNQPQYPSQYQPQYYPPPGIPPNYDGSGEVYCTPTPTCMP
jgi:hypothetical protein